jgi:hypothetical protein
VTDDEIGRRAAELATAIERAADLHGPRLPEDIAAAALHSAVAEAVAAERAACAALVERFGARDDDGRFVADLGQWVDRGDHESWYVPDEDKIAAAIRARGEARPS